MPNDTDEQTIGFKELLLTTRTIDSKNRQVKLGKKNCGRKEIRHSSIKRRLL